MQHPYTTSCLHLMHMLFIHWKLMFKFCGENWKSATCVFIIFLLLLQMLHFTNSFFESIDTHVWQSVASQLLKSYDVLTLLCVKL
jgi:hypothetical protein